MSKQNSISNNIPQNIHLVFFDKKAEWPSVFKDCNIRLKKLHPKWNIKYYDAESAEKIVSEFLPELAPVYKSYPHYIQRADLFRVLVVYLFGGFYLDMDMYCLKTLDELTTYRLVLPEERSVLGEQKKVLSLLDGINVKECFRLGNYMFGGIARHPFWLFYLKEAIRMSTKNIEHEGDILETTGPALLTKVYHKYKKLFPELVVFSNRDRSCLMPYHAEISCHFGNFASHLHQGTWRWMKKKSNVILQNTIDNVILKKARLSIDSKIQAIDTQKVCLTALGQIEKQSPFSKTLHKYLSRSLHLYSKFKKPSEHKVVAIGINSLMQQTFYFDKCCTLIITGNVCDRQITMHRNWQLRIHSFGK